MNLFERIKALLGARGRPETVSDQVLEERILSTPSEREQQAITSEGEQESRLDEGRPPVGPER